MNQFLKVYAKVNLFLQVLEKKSNGYHNILSLMAHVNLVDLLKLEYAEVNDNPEDLQVEVKCGGGLFKDILEDLDAGDNLIVKAVRRASAVARRGGKFSFLLEKNIPAGAGLGGGSADAAGALKLVAPLFGLDKEILAAVAADIGADVPFHLHHGFALCEGIGEKIEELSEKLDCSILICNDDIHINTGRAYSLLKRDDKKVLKPEETERIKNDLRKTISKNDLKLLQHISINDFESVVFKEYDSIIALKRKIIDSGADFAIMTGSGSTVIGLFSDEMAAEKAAEKLRKSVKHVFLTDFA